jgi:hypothetical protein
VFELVGILLEFGRYFHDDVVLVESFVDVRDLALTESVAERVVDILKINAEAAGGVAIDDDIAGQAVHLLIGIDIAKLRNGGQALLNQRSPVAEVVKVVRLQRVLILSSTATAASADVLNSL